MAKELAASLTTPEIAPVLLREEDIDVSLTRRGILSSRARANLMISIHVNTYDTHSRGMMAFYWPGNWRTKECAGELVKLAPRELRRNVARGRAATEEYWPRVRNVLRFHSCDTLLAECGYADNGADRRFLLSRPGQAAVVNTLRAGIIHHWFLKEGPRNG